MNQKGNNLFPPKMAMNIDKYWIYYQKTCNFTLI
nr:MAG TPA: hypothetical protein [Caudoviricetes sp.]